MQKILFIIPPHLSFKDFTNPTQNMRHVVKKDGKSYGNLATDMPLGVLSMSAYAKKFMDIQTFLIDFNLILNEVDGFAYSSYFEFFIDYMKNANLGYIPDIIGLSALFTPSYLGFLDLANCCRELFPQSIIIAGGSVPSGMYNEIFKDCPSFDALCYGEGELPLLELINADDKYRYLESNGSWITKAKVDRGDSYIHNFIEDLDEIPFYDYDLCKTGNYGINPAIMAYAAVEEKVQNFHIMTSRGCPFKCIFCAAHKVHGRKMRYYSIERVKEDFTRLRDEFGVKTLVFQDDHFMGDKQRAYDIVCFVKELNVTAVFQNGLALYALDREMLEALKNAGVNQLVLPVESGSDRVLREVMRKPLKLSIVQRVADDCRDLGIYTNVNILIGLPGETKQDIEDAREFLKTINANWFIVLIANPLVGSEMYEICQDNNYLTSDYLGSDYKRAVVETDDFTSDYIQDKSYQLNLELNFVENCDFKLGNYKTAVKGFENTIRAKHDHAFAYYYAAKCYSNLGDQSKAEKYQQTAVDICDKSAMWRGYADMFHVPI